MSRQELPDLSVIVVPVSDTTDGRCDPSHLAGCLEALACQAGAPALEILVPHPAGLEGLGEIQCRFPWVGFLPCRGLKGYTGRGGSREHHDELRARGLAHARGHVVALLEDVARPAPGWAAALLAAHAGSYAGVGGAIENGLGGTLSWAVYFCDFGKYQNPLAAGESPCASDANVSYKRSALEAIRPVWQDSFHEPGVNAALRACGWKVALCPGAVVFQHRSDLQLLRAIAERFIWGRSFAASRGKRWGGLKRLLYAALSPALPWLLLVRQMGNVVRKGRCRLAFLRALPLVFVLTVSWSCGELAGYLTGNPRCA